MNEDLTKIVDNLLQVKRTNQHPLIENIAAVWNNHYSEVTIDVQRYISPDDLFKKLITNGESGTLFKPNEELRAEREQHLFRECIAYVAERQERVIV